MLFCTFLCCHCMTTTWKCLIASFMEDVNKRWQIFLSVSKLEWGLQEFNSMEICLHYWHFQRIRINTTKFEETRIHFKSDVLVPSPSSMLKLPRLSVKCWWMKLKLSIVTDSLLYRIVSVFMMPEKMWWGWFEEKWGYMYLWCGFW